MAACSTLVTPPCPAWVVYLHLSEPEALPQHMRRMLTALFWMSLGRFHGACACDGLLPAHSNVAAGCLVVLVCLCVLAEWVGQGAA